MTNLSSEALRAFIEAGRKANLGTLKASLVLHVKTGLAAAEELLRIREEEPSKVSKYMAEAVALEKELLAAREEIERQQKLNIEFIEQREAIRSESDALKAECERLKTDKPAWATEDDIRRVSAEIAAEEKELKYLRAENGRLKADNQSWRTDHDNLRIETVKQTAEIVKLRAQLDKLVGGLKKIADYNTLDGEKYVNYEAGWHGVAAFARAILKEIGE